MKYKILVITGSRAEYGLLKPCIRRIAVSKKLSLCLLVTGMHTLKKFGHTINEIKRDKPGTGISHVVKIAEGDDMLGALSREIAGIKKVCLLEKPKAILILGDRDEPFAGAIVGGHLKIPVFHIHGGDITGYSVDEYIRHAITKFSHLHFAATQKSYQRIIKLGEEKWRVFKVGAPGLDGLKDEPYLSKGQLSVKFNLDIKRKWLVVVQHSTPLDKVSIHDQIAPTLRAVDKIPAEKIIVYPNSDSGSDIFIKEISKYKKNKKFHIYKNLERSLFLSLLKNSDVLIGNSSSGIIEAEFFHLPVIDVGNRQLGRETGRNVIHVTYNEGQIIKAISRSLSPEFNRLCRKSESIYGDGRAGEKIVKIIEKNIENPKLFYKKFTYA